MSDLSAPTIVKVAMNVRRVLSTTQAGGAIFSGPSELGESVRVIAGYKVLQRVPVVGEFWEVEGQYKTHPKFGEQLHAQHCIYRTPNGELLVEYLARHPDFVRIGDVKARKLRDTFGPALVSVLNEGDIDALATVLTRATAEQLCVTWAEKRAEGELVAFLDEHGFDLRLANKIRRVWGDRGKEMLQTNPYYMLAFANWSGVDGAASKLGVARTDERRLVGAVEAVLYERLQQKHTVTDHETLSQGVSKRLRLPKAESAIALALAEGAMVGAKETGYQPFGAAALERGIACQRRSEFGLLRPV